MASVSSTERQLTIKLVYYGPPLSGKTTNLQHLHSCVDQKNRGRLTTLDTKDDRTLFFDLLPIFFVASGWSFRFKVYTVPGQPLHEATRRIVLKGVDGVAFVADSQLEQKEANDDSYENLRRNMELLGLQRSRVPIVIQYNKRDLPDIMPESELVPYARIPRPEPVFAASALTGEGVIETFFGLLEQTWDAVDRDLGIERTTSVDRGTFMREVRKHINGNEG